MLFSVLLLSFFFFERILYYDAASETLGCPLKHFKLEKMEICHPWISCEDMDTIVIIKRLGSGAVKDVFLIDWKGFSIVLSLPINYNYLVDFMNGVETLKLLNPSKHIVKFLGFCEKKYAVFTEYHPAGNAADFFRNRLLRSIDSIQSLQFCHQYSLILKHLHSGPGGKRVFCDSNNLNKLLSQLLITSGMRLILNDVDALPEITNSSDGIKCGHRQLEGMFIAPEQLWTKNQAFNDNLMKGYNEKTDIWKAAAVCEFFLKKTNEEDIIRYRLFNVHSKCRNHDPLLRPSSEELAKEYSRALKEFYIHSEL